MARLRHWWIKALLQSRCTSMPGGAALYHQLQRRLGNLRRPDFMRKLGYQRSLVHLLRRHGVAVQGADLFEIGTGWIPFAPIGFWVCGARSIVTVDIRRNLTMGLTRRLLRWMSEHRSELKDLWKDAAPAELVAERLARIAERRDDPAGLLALANIDYRAPFDATRTGLADASVDVHFSYNVLEHVQPATIGAMLAEARRVMKPSAVTFHYVDPTDHFSHFDTALTKIDFLRYEPAEWERIAGNPYAYTNRLRDGDFRALFARSGLELREVRFDIDQPSLAAILAGFPLATPFRDHDPEELSRHNLVYVATPIPLVS